VGSPVFSRVRLSRELHRPRAHHYVEVFVSSGRSYSRDPDRLRDLLLYRLTVEARSRVDASGLSRR
jgi:hypothetical protein